MTADYLKRLGAQGHLRVKQALRKWDPIGVFQDDSDWAEDEYDAYSGPVVAMLDRGASKEEIVGYLKKICVEHIGVGFDKAHTTEVVEELLVYWPAWKMKVRELGPDYISE